MPKATSETSNRTSRKRSTPTAHELPSQATHRGRGKKAGNNMTFLEENNLSIWEIAGEVRTVQSGGADGS